MNFNTQQVTMLFQAIVYTLENEGIELDQKYIDLCESMSTDNIDVSELSDLLPAMYAVIKDKTDF